MTIPLRAGAFVVAIGLASLGRAQAPPQDGASPAAQSPSASPTPAYDEPPKLLKQTKPKYPRIAYNKSIEGVVVVRFTIDEKGRVTDPQVVQSVPELDDAALDAVKQWTFRPAQKDGHPVRSSGKAPITFKRSDVTSPPGY
jgi:TonB family protein